MAEIFRDNEKIGSLSPPERLLSKESILESIESELTQKFEASVDLSREYLNSLPGNYGKVMNQELIGQIFGRAIFGTNRGIPELEKLTNGQPKLQSELEIINRRLPGLRPVNFDNYQDFANQFRDMVSQHNLPDRPEYQGQEYKDVVYFPRAQEEVAKMLKFGPVRIWTAGDMYGIPEIGLSGSGEQRKRIAQAKWGQFRIDALKNSQDFDVYAHEDKFQLLEDIALEYKKSLVKNYVVVDDKIANLNLARARFNELGVPVGDITIIWDRQGNGGLGGLNKSLEGMSPAEISDLEDQYNAVDSVEDIIRMAMSKINPEKLGEKIGWVVDHDDVLSSTKKAKELIVKNILDWLKKKEVY